MEAEKCPSKHRVFVYGTLKQGQPNFYRFQNKSNGTAEFVGSARTEVAYPLIVATRYNLPFLLFAPGKGHIVKGEIYDVDDHMFEFLDDFEGHPEVYQRDQVKVLMTVPKEPQGNKQGSNTNNHSNGHLKVTTENGRSSRGKKEFGTSESDAAASELKPPNGCGSCCLPKRRPLAAENSTETVENSTDQGNHTNGVTVITDSLGQVSLNVKQKETVTGCKEEICWVYFLKRFPPQLAEKKSTPDYDAYGCSPEKRYMPEDDVSGPDNIYAALLEECQ